MISIARNRFGVKLYNVWYAESGFPKKGIITYRESVSPIGKNVTEFVTLISDLRVSEEEMVGAFSKSCRYKINRASREGVVVEIDVNPENATVEEFCIYFGEFWESKGYEAVDIEKIREELLSYAGENTLAISKAILKGKVLVYHTHIMDQNYARLLHSASLFRTEEEIPQSLVGMANRLLHKEEMLFFKHKDIAFYDWGGAGESEEVASITKFKKSFGGVSKTFYHGGEIRGFLPKLAYWYLNRRNGS